MSATTLAAFVAIAAAYATSFWLVIQHFDRQIEAISSRLDRIEARLSSIEVTVAQIGQRLDDHIHDHPGPAQRLTSSR